MRTHDLIERLATELVPVRPMLPPWQRTLLWLAAAGAGLASVAFLMTLRPDLAERLHESRFLIELGAIALTAVLAAWAAFVSTVPGSPARLSVLPVPVALIWLATLGEGCRQAWIMDGGYGPHLAMDWECVPVMLLAIVPPALVMLAMLRRGALVAPARSASLGALAVTALGSFGLKLLHMHDTSFLVLMWLLASLAAAAGLNQVLARTARRQRPVTLT